MVTAVTGAIGAGVGSLAGGAFGMTSATWTQIGWTAGVLVGAYLFSPDGPDVITEGPKLGDLKVTSSSFGESIPIIYGSFRTSGNIIFALPLRETKHEEKQESGKGGGGSSSTNIWYTYDATWAVAFCEGPIDEIGRIWFGSRLVFDGSKYTGGLTSSNHTVYKGTSNQEIDWTIKSKYSNTPAYRHVCYIVFRGIQLEDYGNVIPNVTVEIIKNANFSIINSPIKQYNIISGSITFFGNNKYCFQQINQSTNTVISHRIEKDIIDYSGSFDLANIERTTKVLHSDTPIIICGSNSYNIQGGLKETYNHIQSENGSVLKSFKLQSTIDPIISNLAFLYDNGIVFFVKNFLSYQLDDPISLYRTFGAETKLQNSIIIEDTDGLNITYLTVGNNIYCLRKDQTIKVYDYNGSYLETINLNFSLLFGTPSFKTDVIFTLNEETNNFYIGYGNKIYEVSVIGELIYDYNTNSGIEYIIGKDNIAYCYSKKINSVDGPSTWHTYKHIGTFDNTSIGSIVQDLQMKGGLDQSELDNSIGTTVVKGYSVTKNMSLRSSIEPLLSAFDYYVLEKDFKITLLRNYNQTVYQINKNEIIGKVNATLNQELDRIKQLTVRYINRVNNYEISSQHSLRIDVKANQVKIVELPIVLSDTEAKQLCEKNLYLNWMLGKSYSFSLPNNYNYLIAGNLIDLDGVVIKITKLNFNSNHSISCEGIVIDEEVYQSSAIGADTEINEQKLIEEINYTKTVIKDIHTINNDYLNSEVMHCISGGINESWRGCVILTKKNEPDDYISYGNQVNKGIIGNTLNKLEDGITYRIDTINSVIVNATAPLPEIDKNSLYNGNNYCLVGNEIIQYMNATEVSNGRYELTNLLRGRRGTESHTSTHSNYEDFIFIGNASVLFIPETINASSYYANSTIGFETSDYHELGNFQYSGNNLKPYSPVYFRSKRNTTTNTINLKWMRRSRYISGYMKALPLAEKVEKYTLEVYNDSDLLINAITGILVNNYDYIYIQDGFTSSSNIKFKVYQVSDVVGEGYPSEYIIDYGA